MNKSYSILHSHGDCSLLDGYSRPHEIAHRAEAIQANACAITEHGNLGNTVSMLSELKKKSIKFIYGCELYLSEQDSTIKTNENRSLAHLVTWAKNPNGWKNLLRLTAESNRPENFYYKPRLNLEKLADYSEDLMCCSGHLGSEVANAAFVNCKLAYRAKTVEDVNSILKPDWEKDITQLVYRYLDVFGRDNFFLEIQLVDSKNLPASQVVSDCLRKIGKQENIKCIATADAHYDIKEHAHLQRILLCSALKTTLKEVQTKIDNAEEVGLEAFFRSNNYHIPTYDELIECSNTEEELDNTNYVASLCEDFSVLKQQVYPKFECPNGMTSPEYYRHLCREGWKKKIAGRIPKSDYPIYVDRLENELAVLEEANLIDYMLIIHDIIQSIVSRGDYYGEGRGSSCGALSSYLSGCTSIDPIKYGLYFERFYNKGRGAGSGVDFDLDCMIGESRDLTIQYITQKYGKSNTAQICTYGRLVGKSALKEVLRVYDACSFEEANRICSHIVDESKISDKIQELLDEGEDAGILKWSVTNNPKAFEEYVTVNDDGEFEGNYAQYFKLASQLEGIKKSLGKHPAGLIVSQTRLEEIAPMVLDKGTGELMVGVDMRDAEKLSLCKFDILGVAAINKLKKAVELIAMAV